MGGVREVSARKVVMRSVVRVALAVRWVEGSVEVEEVGAVKDWVGELMRGVLDCALEANVIGWRAGVVTWTSRSGLGSGDEAYEGSRREQRYKKSVGDMEVRSGRAVGLGLVVPCATSNGDGKAKE